MRVLTSSHGTDRTADAVHVGLTVTERGWLTARPFFTEWLFGVASQAFGTEYWVNGGYEKRDVIGSQLYVKTVTFCPFLLRSTFSEMLRL